MKLMAMEALEPEKRDPPFSLRLEFDDVTPEQIRMIGALLFSECALVPTKMKQATGAGK